MLIKEYLDICAWKQYKTTKTILFSVQNITIQSEHDINNKYLSIFQHIINDQCHNWLDFSSQNDYFESKTRKYITYLHFSLSLEHHNAILLNKHMKSISRAQKNTSSPSLTCAFDRLSLLIYELPLRLTRVRRCG